MAPPTRLDNCASENGAEWLILAKIEHSASHKLVGGLMSPPYEAFVNESTISLIKTDKHKILYRALERSAFSSLAE